MERDEQLTAPLLGMLTPVPAAGRGVCRVCHRSSPGGYDRCESCRLTMGQVANPIELVVPISLYQSNDSLWNLLRNYKDSTDPVVRQRQSNRLAAVLARFLRLHAGCIHRAGGGEWDLVTVVPPSKARVEAQPLLAVLDRVGSVREQAQVTLETVARPGHRRASDEAYRVVVPVGGRRVLLVDDTLTSGAALQSAASALAAGGATVVAGLVIGRVIDGGFSREEKELWTRQRRERFSFDRCCLE